jgi:hypothetical protein
LSLQIFLQGASDTVSSGTFSFLMDRSTDTWGGDSTVTPGVAAAAVTAVSPPFDRLSSRLAAGRQQAGKV